MADPSPTCSICGDAYQPFARWQTDWCPACSFLNFEGSQELRLHEELAPARLALGAYVTAPVSDRQRHAMHRMLERWAEEEGLA